MDKFLKIRISLPLVAITLAVGLFAGSFPGKAKAAETNVAKQSWSFNGIFGTYDRPALKRGYKIYDEVCASCHSLNLVAYRSLMELGFTKKEVKAIAAEFEVPGLPDDNGDPTTRPALSSDHFVPPFANDKQARASENGALPPDLSLIVKARSGGADYIYALLTGFKDKAPKGFVLPDGAYYNEAFPGHRISMPPPLENDTVEYKNGPPATLQQEARDVASFLTWTASPELEARKALGIKVILFLIVLTGMLYAWKVKIWKKLH